MKKIIIIALLIAFMTPFLSGVSLAILTTVADGYYYYLEECIFCGSACSYESGIRTDRGIYVNYTEWVEEIGKVCGTDHDIGIMEFDISSMEGVFTSGQFQAELFLKVQYRYRPDEGDICLSFNSITDLEENGIIEEGDVNTTEHIGEFCGNFQPDDIIRVDVTSAIEHDLFDPDQSSFSGFVIDRGTDWELYIEFHSSHTANPSYSPKLCIKDTNSSDDLDGDCISDDTDNCLNHFNPFQEDTYPPQGNGIGDACECEADFDCSGSVDANDVSTFLNDFSRGQYLDPCTNEDPCNGDFSCDGDLDSFDVTKFLEDFGRNTYSNPCPTCVEGDWCVY